MKYREKTNEETKYTKKQQPIRRFNFVYDEDQITFRTEIPQIPTKLKYKPDQKTYTKKVKDLETKIEGFKKQRKQLKQKIEDSNKDFDYEIKENQYNVELGKKCIAVLAQDLIQFESQVTELKDKIQNIKQNLRNFGEEVQKNKNVTLEQMDFNELQKYQTKLNIRMTTSQLSKKEQTQLFNLINKVNRLKQEKAKTYVPPNKSKQQQEKRELISQIEKLNKIKNSIIKRIQNTKMKIQHIQEDIVIFNENIEIAEEYKKKSDVSNLVEEKKALKQNIYNLRGEIQKLNDTYSKSFNQFQYEQQKIKWIKWATEVQQAKNREWEEQKNERKKLKAKENSKQVKKEDGKLQTKQEEKKYQKPKINRYQQQIDCCSFLINYCNDLYPQQENNTQKQPQPQKVNIESALKEGEWAKAKGIQVIVSKKMKPEETKPIKKNNKEDKKKEPKIENKFNHIFQIESYFNKVSVIPPSNVEQLQGTLKSLKEKQQYFLDHPEGKQEQKKNNQKYVSEKYSKIKQSNKRVVNSQDFPTLN